MRIFKSKHTICVTDCMLALVTCSISIEQKALP